MKKAGAAAGLVIALMAGSPVLAGATSPSVTSRTPAAGSSVDAVKVVKIVFASPLKSGKLTVTRYVKMKWKSVGTGTLQADKKTIQASFATALADGRYQVKWSGVNAAGKSLSGSWKFTDG